MRLKNYLVEKEEKDVVKKALAMEEPNGIDEYSEDTIKNNIALAQYAITVQKKNVAKSDEDEVQVAKLKDLEDKLRKWKEAESGDDKASAPPEDKETEDDSDTKDNEDDSEDKETETKSDLDDAGL